MKTILQTAGLIAVAVLSVPTTATIRHHSATHSPLTRFFQSQAIPAVPASTPTQPSKENVSRLFLQPGNELKKLASEEAANWNTEVVRRLLETRSGHVFSPAGFASLQWSERAVAVSRKTVTAKALTETLTRLAVSRLAMMSDGDLDRILDHLRGFRSAATPDGTVPAGEILLRPWGPYVSVDGAREYLRRAKANRDVLSDLLRFAIGKEIENRIRVLAESQPEIWSTDAITPSQAVLLTYSALSGDQLVRTNEDLVRTSLGLRRVFAEKRGIDLPVEGNVAFGVNGIIYSSPLNLFDDDLLKALLAGYDPTRK